MYIRRAISSDFPTLATFSVPAFVDDELYQYTNPLATKYPADFRKHFLRRLKQRNVLSGFVTWVAVEDGSDEPRDTVKEEVVQQGSSHSCEGEIVGYAVWCRYGTSEVAKRWQEQSWVECTKHKLRFRAQGFPTPEHGLHCN